MDRRRQGGYAETVGRRPPTHVDDAGALGARLRRLRKEQGLSLAKLAFQGCSTSYLCKVEAGDRVPSTPILAELARRLDVSIEELAGRDAAGSIPAATILLAEMSARLGEPDAVTRLDELEDEARRSGDRHALSRALEARGLLALERRDDERAIAALEHARTCDPGATPRLRPAMFEALGRAYAGVGDLSRGIALLRTALEYVMRPPADVPAAVRFGVYLASAYTDQGRFAEAEVVLADLIELEPRIADPTARARLQWTLARTYAEQGRLRLAERYGREVLSHLEESEQSALRGRAHLLLGQILLDQRRRREADEELTRAEELMRDAGAGAPELAMLNAERGRSALLAGDLPGAQAAARLALAETEATEPAIAGAACLVLARAALAEADIDEARFLCRKAIDLLEGTAAPHYRAEAHQVLAVVEERAGNPAAALAALWEGIGAVDRGLL
jgi:transcriptional regulator with XRE-family HTH domain